MGKISLNLPDHLEQNVRNLADQRSETLTDFLRTQLENIVDADRFQAKENAIDLTKFWAATDLQKEVNNNPYKNRVVILLLCGMQQICDQLKETNQLLKKNRRKPKQGVTEEC